MKVLREVYLPEMSEDVHVLEEQSKAEEKPATSEIIELNKPLENGTSNKISVTKTAFLKPLSNEFKAISAKDFAYKKYMSATDSTSAVHPLLYHFHRIATMKILRAIFLPEMSVRVISGEHEGQEGVIKSARDYVMIETKDLNLLTTEYKDLRFVFDGFETNFWTKYVDEETANAIVSKVGTPEYSSRPLYSFIKTNQYLEVINDVNASLVDTAEVIENQCGLLRLKHSYGGEEYLHMTSPRLKPLGWVDSVMAKKQLRKSPFYFVSEDAEGVLPFCFDAECYDINNTLAQFLPFKSHKFEEGHLMVAVDPESRFRLLPAVVTEVYNNYFFKLSLLEDCSKNVREWKTITRHASTCDIFAFGQGHKDKCSTTLPKGISSFDKLTTEEISRLTDLDLSVAPTKNFLLPLLTGYTQEELIESHEENFESPFSKTKLLRQLVELYLNNDYSALHIGRIIRVTKYFIFISIETFGKFTPPQMFPLNDVNIFPYGYAKRNNLAIYPPFLSISNPLTPVNLQKYYTTNPFLTNEKLSFMSPLRFDAEHWAPKIYVNRHCFNGPFVNSKRNWRLENSYGPGPLAKVLDVLISDLTACCDSNKIMHILDAKKLEDVFTLPSKHYTNGGNDRQRSGNVMNFTFVGCKSVRRLPDWLNILCRTLDACPGFINIEPMEKPCLYGCTTVKDKYAYMLPEVHVNTAYSLFALRDKDRLVVTKKRKTVVEQLQLTSPKRLRSRLNGLHVASDVSDDESKSRSSSPAYDQRRRTLSTSARPTIVRQVHVIDASSDTSDDDDVVCLSSEDEIPVLSRQINSNEFIQRRSMYDRGTHSPTPNHLLNNSRSQNSSPASEIGYPRFMPILPAGGYRPIRPRPSQVPMRSTGPKILRPGQSPAMLNMNPIIDPRAYRPLPPRPFIPPPQRLPPSEQFIFDPITGKYKTTLSHNTNSSMIPKLSPQPIKASVPTPSPNTHVQQQPAKASPIKDVPEGLPDVLSDPRFWRPAQVSSWVLKAIAEKTHSDPFFNQRITGAHFLNMAQRDLQSIGIPLGPSLRLEGLIQKLRKYVTHKYGEISSPVMQ